MGGARELVGSVMLARLRRALARYLCPDVFASERQLLYTRMLLEELERWCSTDPAAVGAAARWVRLSVDLYFTPYDEYAKKSFAWHLENRPGDISEFRALLRRRYGSAS